MRLERRREIKGKSARAEDRGEREKKREMETNPKPNRLPEYHSGDVARQRQ